MTDRVRWPGLAVAGALFLVACSGGSSRTESIGSGDLSNKTVRVVFELPGDDIGGEQSQKTLQAIKDDIQAKNVARVVGSGFGMGTMEVVLKYEGPGSADELRRIVARIYPEAKYRIVGGTD